VVTMAGTQMVDMPAVRRHRYSYPVAFADGHVDIFLVTDPDTKGWYPGDENGRPSEIDSEGNVNSDLARLRDAATETIPAAQ
jgi:prepilin-type processing-associated H-X9-DG protein